MFSGSYELIKDSNFFKLNKTQQEAAEKYIEVMKTGRISFRQFVE